MRAFIRLIVIKDLNFLIDIDLKSYDYPWPINRWRELADNVQHIILVALIKNQPIGFVVCHHKQDGIEILRIAVKPSHRKQGIGTQLLLAAEKQIKSLHKISIIVPEIQCFPGHENDVSTWLLANGYAAVAPIIKNYTRLYGQDVDGFKFVKEWRSHA